MNLKEIKEIINLMNENNLQEIEIEREGTKVRIKKQEVFKLAEEKVETPIKKESEKLKEKVQPESKTIQIKAPMVGTFYRSPSPDAPPFVEIGDEIENGQTICIIEAMKLMNEIKSEHKGKILEILVENGEPVEFGQVLFVIQKK